MYYIFSTVLFYSSQTKLKNMEKTKYYSTSFFVFFQTKVNFLAFYKFPNLCFKFLSFSKLSKFSEPVDTTNM